MINGWKKDTLGHHIELLTGYPFKSTEYSEDETAIRLLRGDNVVQGSIRWDGVKRWNGPLDNKIQRYSLAMGDFVIAMDRTWVKAGLKASTITDKDTPSLLVQRVARLRAKRSLHFDFLPMLIRSHRFEQYVKGVQTETAVPHISPNQIKDFSVLLPPLPEQKAIADLLSTWDEAIEKTERLIQAKERRFRWLLRELMTPAAAPNDECSVMNDELKNNSDLSTATWKKAQIGTFLTESRIPDRKNDPKKRLSVRLHLKGVEIREYRGTESDGATAYFVRKAGQFIYGKQNVFRGSVGIVPPELDGYSSTQDIPAFDVSDSVCKKWLLFLFSYPNFYKKLELYASGSGSKRLHPKELFKMKIAFPSFEEQQKIAETLSSAQHEIDLLKQLSEKYKTQKRGLMQKMLTGEWRVKPEIIKQYTEA